MSKLGDYFASQCGNPRGFIGKIMTWVMNRTNRMMYKGIKPLGHEYGLLVIYRK